MDLRGLVLRSIENTGSFVNLKFMDPNGNVRELKYQGLLLETPSIQVGSRVSYVLSGQLVGFRGSTQLQREGIDVDGYSKMIIIMDRSGTYK